MCGIVGYTGPRAAFAVINKGLRHLEYRGYDSWGGAVFDKDGVKVVKRVGKLSETMREDLFPRGATCGIGHTRWATHGAPTETNAHPHADRDGKVYVVHNGIIENATALRQELTARGYPFKSQTDTEVIPQLIASFYDGDPMTAIESAMRILVGAFAIAAVFSDRPGEIFGARRGSPLVVGVGHGEMFLASDPGAIVSYTKQVVYLDDDDYIHLKADDYTVHSLHSGPVEHEVKTISFDAAAIELSGYESFMLKEIHEQVESVRNAFRGRLLKDSASCRLDGLAMSDDELRAISRVMIVSCGTSWHAALVGKYLIEEHARIPVAVDYAAEFRYRNPIVLPGTLVLAISQSGETADTLAAVREAKMKGGITAGIVNAVGSSIARECGRGIYLHAGPEIGVASTKAFTSQLVALALLSIKLGRLHDLSIGDSLRMMEAIESLPSLVAKAIEGSAKVARIAEELKDRPNFLFIGRRYQYPVALEGALKLKELSYLHAEGLQAAELKHGPIALIDENMPTVVLATESDILEKVKSNVQEIKARKGRILAVVTEGSRELDDLADWKLEVPSTLECLTPVVSIIPLQLLAYHIAKLRGCNLDKPRNLAKSVTVE
jgi:glucosamine--fructose-6-phosphate aminotransferase (isomerizing)